jgi:hypothetical protein
MLSGSLVMAVAVSASALAQGCVRQRAAPPAARLPSPPRPPPGPPPDSGAPYAAAPSTFGDSPAEPAREPAPGEPPVEPAPVEPAPIEPAPIEPAPIEPAPIEPAPIESRTTAPGFSMSLPEHEGKSLESYQSWTIGADVASLALVAYGGIRDSDVLLWTGVGGFLLAPAAVHVAHRQPGSGLVSAGVRLGAPAVLGLGGAGVGYAVGWLGTANLCCDPLETPTPEEEAENDRIKRNAALIGAAIGVAVGVVVAAGYDYLQSKRPVARDEPDRAAGLWTPVVIPTRGGAGLGVAGRF